MGIYATGSGTVLSARYMRPTLTTDIVGVHSPLTFLTPDIDDRHWWPVCGGTRHCRPSKVSAHVSQASRFCVTSSE